MTQEELDALIEDYSFGLYDYILLVIAALLAITAGCIYFDLPIIDYILGVSNG